MPSSWKMEDESQYASAEEPPVVVRSVDQRNAHENEPVCVICGRFGEYICDRTDQDVCSLECRDLCRERQQQTERTKKLEKHSKALRAKWQIQVQAPDSVGHIPPVIQRFEELMLPEQLADNLRQAFLDTPTPVQMQAIPCALQKHDLTVVAPTGSGKTVAYLVPVLVQIMNKRFDTDESIPLALVLASIRELCIQIESVAKSLMKQIPKMKTALIVGGFPMPPQVYRLQQGVQLIVATPGRLLDLVTSQEDGYPSKLFSAIEICVVDEVDAMLAQGFLSQLGQILFMVRSAEEARRVQFLFFSATLPNSCREMINKTLGSNKDLVEICVGNVKKTASMTASQVTWNVNVTPQFEWVDNARKKHRVFEWLNDKKTNGLQQPFVLVFVESRIGADLLAGAIEKKCKGVSCQSIHSDKTQRERLKILESFLMKRVQVLVTTNILGRGMDLIHVEQVVVFDFPQTVEQFIHLIGRTGHSMDAAGHALVFINQDNASCFHHLIEMVSNRRSHSQCPVQLPRQVYDHVKTSSHSAASAPIQSTPQRTKALAEKSSRWNEWKQVVKKRKT